MTTNNADEESTKPSIVLPSSTPASDPQTNQNSTSTVKDNGIFEFMTPDRAIELYQRIHSIGVPELDWKFYGRRKPGEPENEETNKDITGDETESQNKDETLKEVIQTEFDFDEEFSELQADVSMAINDSLQLKQRQEPGSERKTNLSDIMSDIMKETSHTETE